VRDAFLERFSQKAQEKLQAPVNKARECQKAGRFEMAADFYRQALQDQPGNWVLMNEVSMFLTFALGDPRAGSDMAKLALKRNPSCSSELWNTLGDGLFAFGRTAEAGSAYLRALEINPRDVRARYNLGWVHAHDKDCAAALAVLAEALALDKMGEYRERLLQKQAEVLQLLTQKSQQEYLLMVNLVSKHGKSGDEPKP
jgi:tetratricopeptide (TPR) repeat protein